MTRASGLRRPAAPGGRTQEVERVGPAIQPRHERPQVDEEVEADRASPESEQRLELDDRQRQGQHAEPDRDRQPDQAPTPRIAGEDRPEQDRQPLHPGGQGPQRPGQSRSAELGGPQHQCQLEVDVAGVQVRPEREAEERDDDGRRQRATAVGPVDRPEQEQDRPAAPHEPGDVPRQGRPGHEQRQHPGCVDVWQEWADRVIRVGAVQPQAYAGPVRSGVRPGGLTAGDQAGDQQRERQAEQDDGQDPTRVAQARRLSPKGSTEHAGSPSSGLVHDVAQVHDDAAAAASRPRDGLQHGWWWRGLAHRAGILPRHLAILRRSSPYGQDAQFVV